MKFTVIYTVLAILFTIFAQNHLNSDDLGFESKAFYAKGVITEEGAALIKSGPDKGTVLGISPSEEISVAQGDKVLLYASANPETESLYSYYVSDYYHLDALIWILVIFAAITLLIGGKKGFKALYSLALSLLMIFGVLIPFVKAGYDPVMVSVIIGIITALFTIHIIQGINRTSFVAFTGTAGGLIFAAAVAFIAIKTAHLTGLSTEDSRLLSVYWPDLKFQGLLLSGIIIGALGAIMDVSISISSALSEIKKHKPGIKSGELWQSGINIGKDIMGSMMNTLIFAYVGTSLSIIMLFYGSGTSLVEILNYGFVSEEIARSLIGSFALLATIPITAAVAAKG